MPQEMLIQTAAIPLAVSFVAAGLLRLAGGHAAGRWLAAGGIAVGFLCAMWLILGVPPFPPRTANQKVAYIVAIGFACGALLDIVRVPARPVQAIVAVAAAAAALWLGWRGVERGDWIAIATVAVIGVVGGGAMSALHRERARPASVAAAILVCAAGAALLAGFGSSGALGQLAGALAAATGGFLLWNWPRGRHGFGAAGLLGGGLALVSLFAVLALFTDAAKPALAVLALALAAPALAVRLPGPRWLSADAAGPILVGALAAIFALAAAGIAYLMGGSVYGY